MSVPVIPERHKIQYECLKGGGFTSPAPHYVTRLIEELGLAEYCKITYDLNLSTLQHNHRIEKDELFGELRAAGAAIAALKEKLNEHPIHGPVTISVMDDTRKLGEALEQIKTLQAENLALRELILELEPDADIDELLEVE